MGPGTLRVALVVACALAVALALVALRTSRERPALAPERVEGTPVAHAESAPLAAPAALAPGVAMDETREPPRVAVDTSRSTALVSIDGFVTASGASNVDLVRGMREIELQPGGRVPIEIVGEGRFRAELRLPPSACSQPLTATLLDPTGDWMKRKVHLQRADASTDGEARYAGTVTFELPDWCIVVGTVTAPDGAPITDVTVGLFHDPAASSDDPAVRRASLPLPDDDFAMRTITKVRTDPEGRFALRVARGHQILVVADAAGRRPTFQKLDTTERSAWDVGPLVLTEGAVLSGRVVLNERERRFMGLRVRATLLRDGYGLRLDDLDLALGYDGDAIWHSPVESMIAGEAFELRGLERADHRLELAMLDDFTTTVAQAEPRLVVSAPATNLLLDPRDSQVWIDVRNARTNEPMTAITRIAFASGAHTIAEPSMSRLFRVQPGELYRIEVSADGFASREIEVVGPAPGGFAERTVELQPTALGSLQLVLGEERWSGRGQLMLEKGDPEERLRRWTTVEFTDGRAQLDLLPGEYRGMLDLWDAGVLQGRAEHAAVSLSFEARVVADPVTTRTLELR